MQKYFASIPPSRENSFWNFTKFHIFNVKLTRVVLLRNLMCISVTIKIKFIEVNNIKYIEFVNKQFSHRSESSFACKSGQSVFHHETHCASLAREKMSKITYPAPCDYTCIPIRHLSRKTQIDQSWSAKRTQNSDARYHAQNPGRAWMHPQLGVHPVSDADTDGRFVSHEVVKNAKNTKEKASEDSIPRPGVRKVLQHRNSYIVTRVYLRCAWN